EAAAGAQRARADRGGGRRGPPPPRARGLRAARPQGRPAPDPRRVVEVAGRWAAGGRGPISRPGRTAGATGASRERLSAMDDDALVTARLALHALAERVISPLRVQATGNEIALEARPGGFATPALPGGGWVGVIGTDVVRAG